MDWNQIVEKVTPYIVKIETPNGHGTGYLCLLNEDKTVCGIATAHHVVADADKWQQPLRISKPSTTNMILTKEGERVILLDEETDSAVILLFSSVHKELEFPEGLIPLLPGERNLPIGTEVGWLGFPGIDRNTLCFFSGNVSARKRSAYLIDGVAINGVSGGPVVYSNATDGVQIVGSISAYMPNRGTGGTLPGLSVAQDVTHLHSTATFIKTMDDAQKRKEALESGKGESSTQV